MKQTLPILIKELAPDDIEKMLGILLTPQEYKAIEHRIHILTELTQNIPQAEIAKKYNVGIGTVTRGSREYKLHAPFINKYFK
ncbi:MAG: Trp family transcriptional regulator [Candidatus Pacebacteria bacterium]|jgi:Trp operon repressor|nr:Trp family transcriptional regulator [Candidatus Paceibacterota bacterium]